MTKKKWYETKNKRIKKQKEENTVPSVFNKIKQTVKKGLFILAEAKRDKNYKI